MTVGRICSRVVATATSNETIRAAAQRMSVNDVGTLVVLEPADGGQPIGIVTDRDVAVRCVAADLDPDQMRIASVMSHPVHYVEESAPIEDALAQMAKVGTRRLLVRGDEGRLAGILSLDDILDVLAEEAEAIGRLLKKQQPHVPA
ncbi:MAG TPA: CBS domain-containing protein [Gemmatimonadales bacterium]|nr:CBS domain-containing protein [Gemmatimonadales bacterium]